MNIFEYLNTNFTNRSERRKAYKSIPKDQRTLYEMMGRREANTYDLYEDDVFIEANTLEDK